MTPILSVRRAPRHQRALVCLLRWLLRGAFWAADALSGLLDRYDPTPEPSPDFERRLMAAITPRKPTSLYRPSKMERNIARLVHQSGQTLVLVPDTDLVYAAGEPDSGGARPS